MEELLEIQRELKAPKNQFNSFGKYKYRSCEDILEAVKPLLIQHSVLMTISDSIVNFGDRFYIQATVTLKKGTETERVTALARESLSKKGMDESQITGTASSYARKYALNGIFLIDDTKDADTIAPQLNEPAKITEAQSRTLTDYLVLLENKDTGNPKTAAWLAGRLNGPLTDVQATGMIKTIKEKMGW